MYISIKIEESYTDNLNGTLTLQILKHWSDKFGNYERMIASIPGIPYDQAKSMQNVANKKVNFKDNVIPFKLVVDNA